MSVRGGVVVLAFLGLAATAVADRAAAKKTTDQAVKELYKAGDWRPAMAAYRAALKLDDSYAPAHYYVASAASIIGDLAAVRKELAWLAGSKDKDSVRFLKLAKTDPDLDRAATDPEVRAVLGLPDLAALPVDQRLTERQGTWGWEEVSYAEGMGCNVSSMTLHFKAGGKLSAESSDCDGDALTKQKLTGSYVVDAKGTVKLTWKKAPAYTPIPATLQACADGSCLQAKATRFHRGRADENIPVPAP